jgi:hypothetical protein
MTTDDRFPANVHVLRPRKLKLADRLDQFLEEHALNLDDKPMRCDPTRPKGASVNALTCAACGQPEYLTRDYCRCGHYLRGQLEDEFLAWEGKIHAEHDQLVSATATKMKPLRFIFAVGSPFIVIPMLHFAFWADGLSIFPFFWMLVGFALLGATAVIERLLLKALEPSLQLLNSYTFESFVQDRFFRLKVFGQ